MDSVGIRELKAHLNRYLKRVRAGRRLFVTERGRTIASIHPVEAPHAAEWALRLVDGGLAHWAGGKPSGAPRPVRAAAGKPISAAVLEDRG